VSFNWFLLKSSTTTSVLGSKSITTLSYKTSVALLVYVIYSIFSSPTVPAQLVTVTGAVLVDTGSGYQAITEDLELSSQDKIKTQDGEATLVLYESVVIDLEPNTEVVVEDLSKNQLKLTQPSGSIWAKFTKVTGVKGLEISTPQTVATVRGTFFGLQSDRALLGEGTLDVAVGSNQLTLSGVQKSVLDNGAPVLTEVTSEDRALLEERRLRMVNNLKTVRAQEVAKHKTVLTLFEKRYGLNYEQVLAKLEELDNNDADLNALEQQAPIRLKAMKKIIKMTEEIRSLKKLQI